MKLKKYIFMVFVALLMSFGFANSTKAVNTETVGILPAFPDPAVQFSDSWFIYRLDLGKTKEDAIRMINNKPDTVIIKLYAVDASTTSDGAFSLQSEETDRKDVGSWVKLAANEIEIPPNSEKLVPFTITIPQNTDVGDHIGGIIMQEIAADSPLQGTGVRIITRVGVRIYETVPGAVSKDFSITRFDWRSDPANGNNLWKKFLDLDRRTLFFIGIKNSGNVKLTPKATIEVTNIFGQKVADLSNQEIGVVFPREENKDSVVTWQGMPLLGRYKVKLTTSFFEDGVEPKTQEFVIWAFPTRLAFLIVLLGIIVMLLRLIMKYFREAAKEKMPIWQTRPGETLLMLADRFKLNWKRLARYNEIGKPFHINPGQKLFIPINKLNSALLNQLIAERQMSPPLSAGVSRNKGKKILVLIAILILLGAGAYWWKKSHEAKQNFVQKFDTAKEAPAQPVETTDKTKSGTFKKSSLSVGIATPSGGSDLSSTRLLNKLKLIGYKAEKAGVVSDFSTTTILYNTGKKDQADMLKNDLSISGAVDTKESPGITKDLIVYNLAPADQFLDIGSLDLITSVRREQIHTAIQKGGADDNTIATLKDTIFKGGFNVENEVGTADNQGHANLTLLFGNDAQAGSIEILAIFLKNRGYIVSSQKGAADLGDKIIIVAGKI